MTRAPEQRWVEHHMSTAITLIGKGIDGAAAAAFFGRIRQLEDILSRFRGHSDISRLARGDVDLDHVDPAVAIVLAECDTLRRLTGGDFEHEPQRRSDDPNVPALDVDALAKGWIIDDAATVLRMTGNPFLVNAGGDIAASAPTGTNPWRVGIQHPIDRSAVLGTFVVTRGGVATSGSYERGPHIRTTAGASLLSVTVVGPDLGHADGLATAVYAAGEAPPQWWSDVDPAYGLLTMSADNRLQWLPPTCGAGVAWCFPAATR